MKYDLLSGWRYTLHLDGIPNLYFGLFCFAQHLASLPPLLPQFHWWDGPHGGHNMPREGSDVDFPACLLQSVVMAQIWSLLPRKCLEAVLKPVGNLFQSFAQ